MQQQLEISTEPSPHTIDGLCYTFSRNKIDYSLFFESDRVNVWKTNNQRSNTSNDCFWFDNGKNSAGKPMADFLASAVELIKSHEDEK